MLHNNALWQFYVAGNSKTHTGLHVSARWCIATEEVSFAEGLLQTHTLAAQITTTDKSVRSFSVPESVVEHFLRDQTELISYEAQVLNYVCVCVCVCECV